MNRNDQIFMAQKIRTQYMEKEATDLDALRALDARVKRPASILAYVLGSVSAIVMGAGMSLVMTDVGITLGLASVMAPGIVIGLIGMGLAIANYPIYKAFLGRRKAKYAAEVLALSEKISSELGDN